MAPQQAKLNWTKSEKQHLNLLETTDYNYCSSSDVLGGIVEKISFLSVCVSHQGQFLQWTQKCCTFAHGLTHWLDVTVCIPGTWSAWLEGTTPHHKKSGSNWDIPSGSEDWRKRIWFTHHQLPGTTGIVIKRRWTRFRQTIGYVFFKTKSIMKPSKKIWTLAVRSTKNCVRKWQGPIFALVPKGQMPKGLAPSSKAVC